MLLFAYFVEICVDVIYSIIYILITAAAGEGSCLAYDNYQFAVFMTGVCVTMKTVSLGFYGLSILASRRSAVLDIEMTDKT